MMFRKLFWKIVKGIADKWFQKKIDGDKPKPKEKEVIGPKTQFNTSRLEWKEIQDKKQPKKKGSR